MKLVVAVVQSEDANGLLSQLSNRGFRATRIKTVGTCEGVVVLFIFRGFAALQPRPHTLGCGPDVPSFSASAPAIPNHRRRRVHV